MSGWPDQRYQQPQQPYGGQWPPPQQQPQYPPPPPPQYQPQPQYQPPRRQPPRRGHLGRTIAIIAGCVVLTVIVTEALVHGSSPSQSASAPPASTSSAPTSSSAAPAASATVTYVVTGSGADVTYGPEGSDASGSVPMHKTVDIPANPPGYYSITAQLQGSGSVSCKIEVGGKVVSQSTASGGYNIAQCEIVQDPITGAWQDANSA